MKIDEIRVVDRHRRDLGDIDGLAESIADVGLMNPPLVTAEGRLIAGARRLAAVRKLGWDEVDVIVSDTLDDAGRLLRAERDENTERKDPLLTEALSLGRALEAIYQPEAQERKAEGQRAGGVARHSDELGDPGTRKQNPKPPRVREQVGEAVGMSGATYDRLKRIATDAEDESLLAQRREAAQTALHAIDKGAPSRATYQRYRKDHVPPDPSATKTKAPGKTTVPGPLTGRRLTNANAQARRLRDVIAKCSGYAMAAPKFDVNAVRAALDEDERTRLAREFGEALSALRKLNRELENGR